jgi:hypothetical protein
MLMLSQKNFSNSHKKWFSEAAENFMMKSTKMLTTATLESSNIATIAVLGNSFLIALVAAFSQINRTSDRFHRWINKFFNISGKHKIQKF